MLIKIYRIINKEEYYLCNNQSDRFLVYSRDTDGLNDTWDAVDISSLDVNNDQVTRLFDASRYYKPYDPELFLNVEPGVVRRTDTQWSQAAWLGERDLDIKLRHVGADRSSDAYTMSINLLGRYYYAKEGASGRMEWVHDLDGSVPDDVLHYIDVVN